MKGTKKKTACCTRHCEPFTFHCIFTFVLSLLCRAWCRRHPQSSFHLKHFYCRPWTSPPNDWGKSVQSHLPSSQHFHPSHFPVILSWPGAWFPWCRSSSWTCCILSTKIHRQLQISFSKEPIKNVHSWHEAMTSFPLSHRRLLSLSINYQEEKQQLRRKGDYLGKGT